MSGGSQAPLPSGFRPQSPDALNVYTKAFNSFSPVLQEYMAKIAGTQQPELITNTIPELAGLAKKLNGTSDSWSPYRQIIASGPGAGVRTEAAQHELGHMLTENLFAGAPPGTVDAVLDRLAGVGRNSPGFDEAIEKAYRGYPGAFGGADGVTRLGGDARPVTSLGQPPVFTYESDKEPVPPPMHEYFASTFFAPNGVMPNTGRDAQGRKWDAKGLLESLANYQLYGP